MNLNCELGGKSGHNIFLNSIISVVMWHGVNIASAGTNQSAVDADEKHFDLGKI